MKIALGTWHELGMAVAMTSSIAIVLLGGELPAFAWLVCAAPWISLALARKNASAPGSSATLVGLASVALGVATVVRGGIESSVLAGGETLMGLLTARLLVRKTAAHDLQAISLSLLLVLAGSVLNVKITYIAVFVVYAISAVWALSTRQLLAGAPPEARARTDVVTPAFFLATAAISLAVLASAAVVFAAFPRVGFGDIGAFMHKETRLPGSVGLRGDPRLVGGPSVVARARGVPREAFERGLYLRGAVYDRVTLDGFAQSVTSDDKLPGLLELGEAPAQARYELTVMPVVGDTLLTLGGVSAIRTLGGGNANPNVPLGVGGRSKLDEVKAFNTLVSAMRYDVAGGLASPGYVPRAPRHKPRALADRSRWLEVPAEFDAPLADLARTAVGSALTNAEKADALRAFFGRNFTYSQEPPRFASSPLRTFLLSERHAHCEYFAAAYTMLLRSVGVPARVVGGFQGGAWDDGVVVFAEKNAHAWVEWWDDDAGWIVDDATPLASAPREELAGVDSFVERVRRFWDDSVLDYSLQDQADALVDARRAVRNVDPSAKALLAGLAVPALIAIGVALRSRRRRAIAADEHPLARVIVDAVEKATGRPVPPATTVREAVASARNDALGRALADALRTYEAARFGGRSTTPADVRRHARALKTATSAGQAPHRHSR